MAAARGLPRFRTEQPPYSILSRGVERSVLPENQRKFDAVESLAQLAGDLGCALPQLAVAFPRAAGE